MPVLQKKALFSAFIICQVLRIIQNYMEVSPAKSLILSATIHGGSYFFIQPRICDSTSHAHLRERAIFQACLIKMALSWKCIGRQPYSEGSLSRAVHGVCHYFTGIRQKKSTVKPIQQFSVPFSCFSIKTSTANFIMTFGFISPLPC